MAWSRETLRAAQPRDPVDERFAELLRKVSSGEMLKEDAWQIWLEIKDKNCTSCDGYGGIAFVGSTGPGHVCGRCNGTGVIDE